jgi:hypothetical protein
VQTLGVNGNDEVNGIDNWTTAKWFIGNIQTCNAKGMRLPTYYETDGDDPGAFYIQYMPTSDGSPTFAGPFNGVPHFTDYTWTATAQSNNISNLWQWRGSLDIFGQYWGYGGYVRCVLP